MESRNPVFNNSKAFSRKGYATFNDAPTATAGQLEDMYTAPSATAVDTGRMTMDDVVIKTGLMFAVLLPLAVVNYVIASPLLTFGGVIVGLVLGLVVVLQAVDQRGADPVLCGRRGPVPRRHQPGLRGPLGRHRRPGGARHRSRCSRSRCPPTRAAGSGPRPKFRKTVLIAMGGYLVFCLVNLVVMLAGGGGDFGLRQGPLGFVIGLFAVGLAAAMLILDFDFAEQGVKNGLPERYSWLAAFGLVVTLVWLYIEMLRLIAILRGD